MRNVTVYSSTSCVYCVLVKNFLKEQGVDFKEVSVDDDPALVQKLINSTGRMGIPQVEIDGKWVVGYQPNDMMYLLDN